MFLRTHVQLAALVVFLALIAPGARAADLAVLTNGFEIRHEQRQVIGSTTRLYLGKDHSVGYVDIPTAQIERFVHDDSVRLSSNLNQPVAEKRAQSKPLDVSALVDQASKAHAIDPDFISSVIHAESSYNPKAVSSKGAQGLMQLMPGTAANLGVTNAFDPKANVDGGTKYLRELLERYRGDIPKALAAYNAGPERVDQYHGVPPYTETRQYVARIIREFNKKKVAEKAASTKASVSRKKLAGGVAGGK